MLKSLLFQIAKVPFMGQMVGNAFRYCHWAIPVKKVYGNKEIIAFHHPQPSYENHIILSPKKAIRDLQQMSLDGFDPYFIKIWEGAKDICAMLPEYNASFVLVANGGKRQEVQQVHFHMFTHHERGNEYAAQEQTERVFYRDRTVCILEPPQPKWEIHFVVKPVSPAQMTGKHAYFKSVLQSIAVLDAECSIVQRGYSLVYQYHKQKTDQECPVFHIVSGKKRNEAI